MKNSIIDFIRKIIRKFGIDIVKYHTPYSPASFPPDFDEDVMSTIIKVSNYTQTSIERIFALCEAVRYIVANNVEGDIVECGVWKGGSMMAVAHTLLQLSETDRNLYLFDTFEGMTEPTKNDVSVGGVLAFDLLNKSKKEDRKSIWCYSTLEEVKASVNTTGYNQERIYFIKGKVEDTIPEQAPSRIALLRLDTDWYESTRHELIHLIPRMSPFGVIIIDDYGHWQGARKAVDDYIKEHQVKILLNRIDYTGRIGVIYPK